MTTTDFEDSHRVRFGATVAAVAATSRYATAAVLVAWAAHFAVHAIPAILATNHIIIPPLPFGPPAWSNALPVSAAMAVVSGLLIRWLLDRSPVALRLDSRLMAYVGLLILAFAVSTFVSFLIVSDFRGKPLYGRTVPLLIEGIGVLLINVAYALLALWPISVLMGDRLPIGAALARMRQGFWTYVGLAILVALPSNLYLPIRISIARSAVTQFPERLLLVALGGVSVTLTCVVLAQIYSRRVRGCDLGQDPPGALADVFE